MHPWKIKNEQIIYKRKAKPLVKPEPYTVEYSFKQNRYHLSPLSKTTRNNLINIQKGIDTGFCLVGLFNTKAEAEAFVNSQTTTNEN